MKTNLKVITNEDHEIDYTKAQVVSIYNEEEREFEELMIEILKQVVLNK
ncbi:MAG: hypothetical protein ACM3UU_01445 [Ignavibacteriales bacterium]